MPNFASLLIGNKIFKDFSMDWINDLLWGEGMPPAFSWER